MEHGIREIQNILDPECPKGTIIERTNDPILLNVLLKEYGAIYLEVEGRSCFPAEERRYE